MTVAVVLPLLLPDVVLFKLLFVAVVLLLLKLKVNVAPSTTEDDTNTPASGPIPKL